MRLGLFATAFIPLFTALILSGCASRLADAESVARPAALTRSEITTDTFRLTAFTRLSDAAAPTTIYIEGDGLAWKSISEPSLDPTPRNAVALRLAALDAAANVVYLARPCQFTQGDRNCRQAYWTDKRFAEEVIASINQAIDTILRNRANRIHLVGYSGGGAVAALIAARRNDVASLRTVAGNLDHDGLNRHHGVSLMPASLNALTVAPRLSHLPQQHFYGSNDKVVPAFIVETFVSALGDNRCATVTRVNGASHTDGWTEEWRRTVNLPPRCR